MLRALLVLAFVGPIFISGGRQTTGTPPVDTFVTLAESTTFGPGGTIADLTGRFAYPEYIPPKTDWTGWTDDTSLKDGGCSADDSTWNTFKTLTTTVADYTRIWLPDDCKILAFITPTTGGGSGDLVIPGSHDGLAIYCEDPDVCGFELRYDTSGSPQWDYTAGAANAAQLKNWLISVGSSQSPVEQSCTWTGGYDTGTKKLELGCSVATSGDNTWAAGDIVRLTVDPIEGFGSANFNVVAEVTCVDGSTSGTSDRAGTDCTELTGDNQIQINNPLPMDYNPTAYFWGANAGTNFTNCTSQASCGSTQVTDTYAETDGHTVAQIEQKSGTDQTDEIAEDIYFVGVGWGLYPEYIGGAYVRVLDGFNVQFYRNDFDARVGAQNVITTGGSGPGEASHVSIHSSDFSNGSFKTTCYAEITGIAITDANTLTITYDNSSTCNFSNAGGDDSAAFTTDVDEPKLAGKSMVKTASVFVSTTPARRSFTVDLDTTTGVNECAEGTGDPCEGIAIDLDKYDNAMVYCNNRSSNVQLVNNVFYNSTQSQIVQSGCSQYVFVNNYTTKDTTFRAGRGPFHHGNAGAPGHIFEGNDSSHSFQPFDGSNRRPTDNGEGVAHTYFKNRCREVATDSPATGGYTTSGTCFTNSSTAQMGASNEDWSILLNAGKEMVSGTMDNARNYDSSGYPTTTAAPHNIYRMWWYRNRCTGSGCNQDDNFDAVNTSTVRDNSATDQDESATVPAGWSAEIGEEPTSLFFTEKPEFWCNESFTFGEIGSYYDNFSGTLGKLPAQIRYEGTTCTLP
jgi:hypothetical protein